MFSVYLKLIHLYKSIRYPWLVINRQCKNALIVDAYSNSNMHKYKQYSTTTKESNILLLTALQLVTLFLLVSNCQSAVSMWNYRFFCTERFSFFKTENVLCWRKLIFNSSKEMNLSSSSRNLFLNYILGLIILV